MDTLLRPLDFVLTKPLENIRLAWTGQSTLGGKVKLGQKEEGIENEIVWKLSFFCHSDRDDLWFVLGISVGWLLCCGQRCIHLDSMRVQKPWEQQAKREKSRGLMNVKATTHLHRNWYIFSRGRGWFTVCFWRWLLWQISPPVFLNSTASVGMVVAFNWEQCNEF